MGGGRLALPEVLCKRLNGDLRNVCHLLHTLTHTHTQTHAGEREREAKSKMKINCDGQGRWHVRFAQ